MAEGLTELSQNSTETLNPKTLKPLKPKPPKPQNLKTPKPQTPKACRYLILPPDQQPCETGRESRGSCDCGFRKAARTERH